MITDAYESILDELLWGDGQTESEIKMHRGMSQQSCLLDDLRELEARGVVRCDGADRWWLVRPVQR